MESIDPSECKDVSDRDVNGSVDVCSVDFSDDDSSLVRMAGAVESCFRTCDEIRETFFLDLVFKGSHCLVCEAEDNRFPDVASGRINRAKTQGPHKVVETVTSTWLRAIARHCPTILPMTADLDDLSKFVEEDEKDWRTDLRTNNSDRLPHFEQPVTVWHSTCNLRLEALTPLRLHFRRSGVSEECAYSNRNFGERPFNSVKLQVRCQLTR